MILTRHRITMHRENHPGLLPRAVPIHRWKSPPPFVAGMAGGQRGLSPRLEEAREGSLGCSEAKPQVGWVPSRAPAGREEDSLSRSGISHGPRAAFGARDFFSPFSWGFASLHPRLPSLARWAKIGRASVEAARLQYHPASHWNIRQYAEKSSTVIMQADSLPDQ
jgi:hypothetical protein